MGVCANDAGVKTTRYSGPNNYANETGESNATALGTGSAAKPPPPTDAAGRMDMGLWGLVVGGLVTVL